MSLKLTAALLSKERFAPYGNVVETSREPADGMNEARFERFDDLCGIDLDDAKKLSVSIARCRVPSSLPLRLDMVERHPLGSQAFIPLTRCKMLVVVAPPGESVEASELRAFVSNGRQGINYHRGTWHMPLIAFEEGQEYLIIDRLGDVPNCDIHSLDEPVFVDAD